MTNRQIHFEPLSYIDSLAPRQAASIDLVVVHCTELPELSDARDLGERIVYPTSATGNSGHFYIERNGRVEQWVPSDRIAHHVRGYNPRSIGIELVNRGRYPRWLDSRHQKMTEPYPEAQIQGLLGLLDSLGRSLPGLCWICGHEELDRETVPASDDPALQVHRKLDPGPLFPWQRVLAGCALQRFPG
jgi:N-acetylmuramoyl-L-alanine amidase